MGQNKNSSMGFQDIRDENRACVTFEGMRGIVLVLNCQLSHYIVNMAEVIVNNVKVVQ